LPTKLSFASTSLRSATGTTPTTKCNDKHGCSATATTIKSNIHHGSPTATTIKSNHHHGSTTTTGELCNGRQNTRPNDLQQLQKSGGIQSREETEK
jgi:hypothetical protein